MDVKGMVMAAALMAAGAVHGRPVVAVCEVGLQAGSFTCYDTAWESQEYVDCTDGESPPIGSTSERGSGLIEWGNTVAGKWEPNGRALYEWSGRQDQAGGVTFALLGVDEDRIFGDGLDRSCRAGRFAP